MSKRQEPEKAKVAIRERLGALASSLSLTFEERVLVTAILVSMLAGAAAMDWRREYRLTHPIELHPSPAEGSNL